MILRLTDNFLDLMGFNNLQDFIGISTQFKLMSILSLTFSVAGFLAGLTTIIETWAGISILLWLFLTLGAITDIGFGFVVNVFFLKYAFCTRRFFRGVFKAFVTLFLILLTNTLKRGVETSVIDIAALKVTFEYLVSFIHYIVVLLIALYQMAGIAENGAKINIRICVFLSKIMKIKIKDIENLASQEDK